jgi:REP element-mobilizing transposase RayT
MARKIRIQYAGAVYHVMARGNQGRGIYANDQHRELWLQTLAEACGQTGWRVHAYVLLPNHYHLLVETPEANLVAGMKWLQSTYAQRYNSRHKVFGHLFQGRYKALVVDGAAGNYFGVVSTYIHLNPARAHLLRVGKDSLGQYQWSSYPAYVRAGVRRPPWLTVQRIMSNLGLRPGDRAGYTAYVEGRMLELKTQAGRRELNEQWRGIRRGWYLGEDDFRESLLERVAKVLRAGRKSTYSGGAKVEHGEGEAERMLKVGLGVLGMGAVNWQASAKGMAQKQVLAWWLCGRTTVSRRWVS